MLTLAHGDPVRTDRVIALPRLLGPGFGGLPADAQGFLRTDDHGRVAGLEDVYAAGDVTSFPVKQGGLAAQQADAVAEAIAARLGAAIDPQPFRPVLRGLLKTGAAARYLAVGTGESPGARPALWCPESKIFGRYLLPYLGGEEALTVTARGRRGLGCGGTGTVSGRRCEWAGRHGSADAGLPRPRVGRPGARRPAALRAADARGRTGRALVVDDPAQARRLPALRSAHSTPRGSRATTAARSSGCCSDPAIVRNRLKVGVDREQREARPRGTAASSAASTRTCGSSSEARRATAAGAGWPIYLRRPPSPRR